MTGPQTYRSKPKIIEAILWNRANPEAIVAFCGSACYFEGPELFITTLEGNHHASPGDYIIKGIKGEFYPCKPDIFEKSYELITK